MSKYIVTGGTGFIGRALASSLRNSGNQVIVIGRQVSETSHADVFFSSGNSTEQLIEQFNGAEAVFHLATYFSNSNSSIEIGKMLESNIDFSNKVAMATRIAGVKYLINMESMSQHVEGKIGNSKNYYAFTKNIGSKSIEFWGSEVFSTMNLCLFDTYGETDTRGKLIQTLLLQSSDSNYLELSKGDQLVDYLHIDDVVSGIIESLEVLRLASAKKITNCRYRLTSYSYPSLRQLIAQIEDILSVNFKIKWGARDYRDGEMFFNWEFPPPLPGWLPTVKLELGIRTTATYYENSRAGFNDK